jgi:23S rRNA pseudouridine1911/1915/1917 synthase
MEYFVERPSTLLEALKVMYPDSSHRTLRNMLKNRSVRVDNVAIVKADAPLKRGQKVRITSQKSKIDGGIDIIYSDKDIVLINKPEGLLSVPLDGGKVRRHVLGILRKHFKTREVYPVHRIDRGTSGVMIFARTERAMRVLMGMFKDHDFTRKYIAVVQGRVSGSCGTWESYLMEVNDYEVKTTPDADRGKKAITHYVVTRRTKNFSYLDLTIETGRKHQIRVHCQEAGHPIVGDKRYGSSSSPISRMCLHAAFLEFRHPTTRKKMSFSAPLPGPFARLGL